MALNRNTDGAQKTEYSVTLAVADTNAVHSRMTDLFHSRGGVEVTVIQSLGRLLYLELAGRAA